jgi:predicted MPP superfamily phosphohydrolase
MKTALVHISDLHFKGKSDVGFKRLDKLANAISFARSSDESVFLVVTGDIASTGAPEEYEVAAAFFRQLLTGLSLEGETPRSPIIFIPGNHDCDFRSVGDLRQILLDQIHDQLESIDTAGETVRAILQVQKNFFQFNAEMTGINIPEDEQLFFRREVEFGSTKLEVRCFNSAWLSSRHESTGTLGLPGSIAKEAAQKTSCDAVISLIHHPFNWMDINAYQSFRKSIQLSSDFLLTGHEHSEGGQVIAPFDGGKLIHLESGPYQPRLSGESHFCIIHLDLGTRQWRREAFSWQSGAYSKIKSGELQKLGDKSFHAAALTITESYLEQINDPGTGFLHPRKNNLTLTDIYVYPDLQTRHLSNRLKKPNELPKEIPGTEALVRLLSADKVVIAGPIDSGKTGLSKMLFLDGYSEQGRSCLLLQGSSFKGNDPANSYENAIAKATVEIYGQDQEARYTNLDRQSRALIIDDWDEISFNRAGREIILKMAAKDFGTVILFSDDIFLIEEISGRHEHMPLRDFQVADIREFGFRLRGQMIRKWHSLGIGFLGDERAIARVVAESTRVVDTVLGRNLLPSYPVNVLTLLQTYDASAGTNTGGVGSYGQVYEALITARLARVSIKSIDIGTKMTLLSRLAWYLFSHQKQAVDESEWKQIVAHYFRDYAIMLDHRELLDSLTEADILRPDPLGFKFAYGYVQCYFVAKYFQENLADLADRERAELYEKLKFLSERVYKQDNADIVIFYVFLTKDRELINHLLANARQIFSEFAEFDFNEQVAFINRIIIPSANLELPTHSHEVNQQEYDRKRDEAGEQIEPVADPKCEGIVYSQSLTYEQKLVIGIRYLMLLGQVLRNFPGSLKKDLKTELAAESYSLGLRILGSIFQLAGRDSASITKDIENLLVKKFAFSGTDDERKKEAEIIMADLLRHCTFGILKRLSHAIGLSELEETYEEVATIRNKGLSSRMIQLSIRLDHFDQFPKNPIDGLAKDLRNNAFSYQTLKDLVLNYFYLFPTDYTTQQWAGKLLGFKVNTPLVRGASQKLLKG